MNTSKGPKLEIVNTDKHGQGVYAAELIKQGSVIYVLKGEIISFEECVRRIHRNEEVQDDSLRSA